MIGDDVDEDNDDDDFDDDDVNNDDDDDFDDDDEAIMIESNISIIDLPVASTLFSSKAVLLDSTKW